MTLDKGFNHWNSPQPVIEYSPLTGEQIMILRQIKIPELDEAHNERIRNLTRLPTYDMLHGEEY